MQTNHTQRTSLEIICNGTRVRFESDYQNYIKKNVMQQHIFHFLHRFKILIRLSRTVEHDSRKTFHDRCHESKTVIREKKNNENEMNERKK